MATNNPPTVDGQNFANNAFSNLAPLLTLFGDELTKQFLSTSMGWADDILLGIAPIGIITIVISAIRVGGNRLLKSLIGRARDSPDDEEKELLSSTSANVREIWDGTRVLRQVGESKTVRLVYDPCWDFSDPGTFYYDHVVDFCGPLLPLGVPWSKYRSIEHRSAKPVSSDDGESNSLDVPNEDDKSSNLTLNIDKAVPETWKVILFVCFGLLIQATVMAVNAMAVYRWHWLRGGRVVASYGYPVWATGTISINIGVSICARVVESSATKYTVGPDVGYERLRVITVQRKFGDFPAYTIDNNASNRLIRISRRNLGQSQGNEPGAGRSTRRVALTVLGAFLALGGFICQNIGTRELNWSAGVLQLGVTLILTVLRAWLRRHVGDPPHPAPVELLNGAEASELASRLEQHHCFLLSHFGGFWGYDWEEDSHGPVPALIDGQTLKKKLIPQKNAEPDDCTKVMHRILKVQSTLAEHEPDNEEVRRTASNLCNAMKEAFGRVYGAGHTRFQDLLRVLMMVTDPSVDREDTALHAIVPYQFPEDPDSRRALPIMQAIISLTCYKFKLTVPTWDLYSIWHYLGHCKSEDVEARENLLRARIGPAASIRIGKINTDEHILKTKNDWDGMEGHVMAFGLQLTSIFDDRTPADYVPEYEFFCQPHETSLEENIALDLFSSFVLGGATHAPEELARFMQDTEGAGCDILADILVKHNVCKSRELGQMAIVPPLIVRGLLSCGDR